MTPQPPDVVFNSWPGSPGTLSGSERPRDWRAGPPPRDLASSFRRISYERDYRNRLGYVELCVYL